MNLVDKLLKFDPSKVANPERKVTLKLPKLGNKPFEFNCKALDADVYAEIQEEQVEYKIKKKGGAEMKFSTHQGKLKKILFGCAELKNKELIAHFGVKTPFELIEKILVPGNIDDLSDVIDDLSGYELDDDEIEEEIENL